MKAFMPISLKRLVAKQLANLESGRVTKDQARDIIKRQCRYSSKTRQQIISDLTERYDQETAEALQFFGLL